MGCWRRRRRGDRAYRSNRSCGTFGCDRGYGGDRSFGRSDRPHGCYWGAGRYGCDRCDGLRDYWCYRCDGGDRFITDVGTFGGGVTNITVYGGTGYTLANAAISANYHSMMKAPFGFPLDTASWTVEVTDTTQRSQANPTNGTWYNLGSISINVPIGCWRLYYEVAAQVIRSTSSTGIDGYATSAVQFSSLHDMGGPSGSNYSTGSLVHREKIVTLAAKSTRYLNMMSDTSSTLIVFQNSIATCVIRAVCAYL